MWRPSPINFLQIALENFSFTRDDAILPTIRTPRAPNGEEEEQPEAAHDHQDHADRVEVDPLSRHVDGESENGSSGEEEQTHADTHVSDLPVRNTGVENLPAPHCSVERGVPSQAPGGNEGSRERSDSSYSLVGRGASASN